VAFQVTGPFELMSHCHCSRCRKAHGTAFGTYVMCGPDDFRLLRGRERIGRYVSSPGFTRPFCTQCGSVVPDGEPWEGRVAMPAGILDDDPGVRPLARIFVGSNAPWYDVEDDLPRFDAYPPGFDGAPPVPDLQAATATDGLAGTCLCGAVAYVASGEPIAAVYCHCSRCRKATASAHASNIVVPVGGLRFTRGEDRRRLYRVPGANVFAQAFCGDCGGALPRVEAGDGLSMIPLGSLDVTPPMKPSMHIHVGSRASWYDIPGGLPQHEGYPG
jgi:hypothetical protein